jgi:hypothetical protein
MNGLFHHLHLVLLKIYVSGIFLSLYTTSLAEKVKKRRIYGTKVKGAEGQGFRHSSNKGNSIRAKGWTM